MADNIDISDLKAHADLHKSYAIKRREFRNSSLNSFRERHKEFVEKQKLENREKKIEEQDNSSSLDNDSDIQNLEESIKNISKSNEHILKNIEGGQEKSEKSIKDFIQSTFNKIGEKLLKKLEENKKYTINEIDNTKYYSQQRYQQNSPIKKTLHDLLIAEPKKYNLKIDEGKTKTPDIILNINKFLVGYATNEDDPHKIRLEGDYSSDDKENKRNSIIKDRFLRTSKFLIGGDYISNKDKDTTAALKKHELENYLKLHTTGFDHRDHELHAVNDLLTPSRYIEDHHDEQLTYHSKYNNPDKPIKVTQNILRYESRLEEEREKVRKKFRRSEKITPARDTFPYKTHDEEDADKDKLLLKESFDLFDKKLDTLIELTKEKSTDGKSSILGRGLAGAVADIGILATGKKLLGSGLKGTLKVADTGILATGKKLLGSGLKGTLKVAGKYKKTAAIAGLAGLLFTGNKAETVDTKEDTTNDEDNSDKGGISSTITDVAEGTVGNYAFTKAASTIKNKFIDKKLKAPEVSPSITVDNITKTTTASVKATTKAETSIIDAASKIKIPPEIIKGASKTISTFAKFLGPAGIILSAYQGWSEAETAWSDLQSGKINQDTFDNKIGDIIGDMIGGTAGTAILAELGAIAGTLTGPAAVIFTPLLAAAGGIGGYFGGSFLGKKIAASFVDIIHDKQKEDKEPNEIKDLYNILNPTIPTSDQSKDESKPSDKEPNEIKDLYNILNPTIPTSDESKVKTDNKSVLRSLLSHLNPISSASAVVPPIQQITTADTNPNLTGPSGKEPNEIKDLYNILNPTIPTSDQSKDESKVKTDNKSVLRSLLSHLNPISSASAVVPPIQQITTADTNPNLTGPSDKEPNEIKDLYNILNPTIPTDKAQRDQALIGGTNQSKDGTGPSDKEPNEIKDLYNILNPTIPTIPTDKAQRDQALIGGTNQSKDGTKPSSRDLLSTTATPSQTSIPYSSPKISLLGRIFKKTSLEDGRKIMLKAGLNPDDLKSVIYDKVKDKNIFVMNDGKEYSEDDPIFKFAVDSYKEEEESKREKFEKSINTNYLGYDSLKSFFEEKLAPTPPSSVSSGKEDSDKLNEDRNRVKKLRKYNIEQRKNHPFINHPTDQLINPLYDISPKISTAPTINGSTESTKHTIDAKSISGNVAIFDKFEKVKNKLDVNNLTGPSGKEPNEIKDLYNILNPTIPTIPTDKAQRDQALIGGMNQSKDTTSTGIDVSKAKPEVLNAIKAASQKTGVDEGYLMAQAQQESSFRADAKAGTSSASGLYQFIDSTWLDTLKKHGKEAGYGDIASHIVRDKQGILTVDDPDVEQQIMALKTDANASATMGAYFASDNKKALSEEGIKNIGSTELYAAHFLGASGATKFLKARQENGNQSAVDILGEKVADNNKNLFYKNGKEVSVNELYNSLNKKVGSKADAYDIAQGNKPEGSSAQQTASSTYPTNTPITAQQTDSSTAQQTALNTPVESTVEASTQEASSVKFNPFAFKGKSDGSVTTFQQQPNLPTAKVKTVDKPIQTAMALGRDIGTHHQLPTSSEQRSTSVQGPVMDMDEMPFILLNGGLIYLNTGLT